MAVKERPILMTGPMVRATMDELKTNTRRLQGLEDVNAYPGRLEGDSPMGPLGYRGLCESDLYIRQKRDFARNPGLYHWFLGQQDSEVNPIPVKCPYGVPGDRLWVRETLVMREDYTWVRKADGSVVSLPPGHPDTCWMLSWAHHQERDYCPSIHMPRWASRLILEITGVRAEQLQSISAADIRAEGVACPEHDFPGGMCLGRCAHLFAAWRRLWISINGQQSWDANPFVWAVEFRRLEVQP